MLCFFALMIASSAGANPPRDVYAQMLHHARSGDSGAVGRLVKDYPFTGADSFERALHLKALLDTAGLPAEEMIAHFRTLSEAHPHFTLLSLTIGDTYRNLKQYRKARNIYIRLAERHLENKEIQKLARARIALTDRLNPWKIHAGFSVEPSTNINSGSADSTVKVKNIDFELPDSSVGKSGAGVRYFISAQRRILQAQKWEYLVGSSGMVRDLPEGSFDTQTLNHTHTLKAHLTPRTLLQASGNLRFERTGSDHIFGYGVSSKFSGPLTEKFVGEVKFSLGNRDYREQNEADATQFGVAASLRIPLAAKINASAGGKFSRSNAQSDFYSYEARGLNLSGLLILPRNFIASPAGSYSHKKYDSVHSAIGERRRDRFWSIGVGLQNSRISYYGLSPKLRLAYNQNTSNVDFESYEGWTLSFGLDQRF